MMPEVIPKAGVSYGSYELVRPLGSGGMGTVFEAQHLTLGRRAALKVLHRPRGDEAATARAHARFLREGRAAAQVRHPHIIDVFDFGVQDGNPYLIMELVRGETLEQLLRKEGSLSAQRAVEIILPIVSAVAELHACGIIHRDIKPANVLLDQDRWGTVVPKLGDFGVSFVANDAQDLTQSGIVLGTLAYMAPERAKSAAEVTERSDQYAIGVMLYELVCGARPFAGETTYELLHAIATSEVTPIRGRAPSLSSELERVILRAIARDPQSRFGSVDELGKALLTFASPEVGNRWAAEFDVPNTEELPEDSAIAETAPRFLGRAVVPRPWFVVAACCILIGVAVIVSATARHARAVVSVNESNVSAPSAVGANERAPAAHPSPPEGRTAASADPSVPRAQNAITGAAPASSKPASPKTKPAQHSARPTIDRGQNGAAILDVE